MMRRFAVIAAAPLVLAGTNCSSTTTTLPSSRFASSSSCSPSLASQVQNRPVTAVGCPAVLRMAPPSPSDVRIGKAVSMEDVAKVYGVSVERVKEVQPPRMILFTKIDLARSVFSSLIQTVTPSTPDLRTIAKKVQGAMEGGKSGNSNSSSSTLPSLVKGGRTHFETKEWSSVEELVQFYEEVLYPIRCHRQQYEKHLLNSYNMKDVLKRGLSAFKQEQLDENKVLLEKEQEGMSKSMAAIAEAVKESFTTEICNDIVNILRICGEQYEHAHSMAVKVLEDMNMMKIPFNEITRELVQVVSFQDGPFDNTPLLFEIIECPERGEISLDAAKGEKTDLEASSTETLKIISRRHQTALDDGKLLRSTETHPNLQRSPE